MNTIDDNVSVTMLTSSNENKDGASGRALLSAPTMHPDVVGLFYWPQFISPSDAKSLTDMLSQSDALAGITSSIKSRRVAHYGYKYDYTRAIDPIKCDPIPEAMSDIVKPESIFPVSAAFDQLIINEYLPGQGIAAHVDHPQQFGDVVFCLSLGSGIMINFIHPDGRVVRQYVVPGSAYAMTKDARNIWKHQIEAKKSDIVNGVKVPRGVRYSLTFRTIRR